MRLDERDSRTVGPTNAHAGVSDKRANDETRRGFLRSGQPVQNERTPARPERSRRRSRGTRAASRLRFATLEVIGGRLGSG